MLGAPVTLWDLDGSEDDSVSALLMGLTIISIEQHAPPVRTYFFPPLISPTPHYFLIPSIFFRPPLLGYSPR
jgi:hypothetical protein